MNQKEEIKRLARPYARLVRWSDEDECFVGLLPELDGDCTHGSTVEEVARNLDECAELYVEDCLTDGTPRLNPGQRSSFPASPVHGPMKTRLPSFANPGVSLKRILPGCWA